MKKVTDILIKGVKEAYNEAEIFNFKEETLLLEKLVEYHIIIKVAVELYNFYNEDNYPTFDIIPECKTGKLISRVFKEAEYNTEELDLFHFPLNQLNPVSKNKLRKGYVDIGAIHKNDSSAIPIEIKSINTSWKGIEADFERIATLLSLKDKESNFNNILNEGYVLFIRQNQNKKTTENKSSINVWTTEIEEEIISRLTALISKLQANVDFNIIKSEIKRESLDDICVPAPDLGVSYDALGIAVAFCVKITHKTSSL